MERFHQRKKKALLPERTTKVTIQRMLVMLNSMTRNRLRTKEISRKSQTQRMMVRLKIKEPHKWNRLLMKAKIRKVITRMKRSKLKMHKMKTMEPKKRKKRVTRNFLRNKMMRLKMKKKPKVREDLPLLEKKMIKMMMLLKRAMPKTLTKTWTTRDPRVETKNKRHPSNKTTKMVPMKIKITKK